MNGVRQDGDALLNIAEEIADQATAFNNETKAIFEEMALRLGMMEDDQKAWWGPQAELFLQNFNKREETFTNAYNNIMSMSNNLQSQAEAWNSFENAG